MIVYPYLGQPLTHQKVVNTSATVFSAAPFCYEYREHEYTFDSGGTLTPLVGNWIQGATTHCRARIVKIGTLTGATTWAGGDAEGTMRICSMHGTATSSVTYFDGSENISVVGTANDMGMTSLAIPYEGDGTLMPQGKIAKAALYSVYANTALCCWDGSIPDQTQLHGTPMAAGSSIIMTDENAIRNFKCLDYTNGSNSIVYITYFF
jgi:hypothetical protein